MKCVMCRHWSLDGAGLRQSALTFQDRPKGYGFCLLSEYPAAKDAPRQEAFAVDGSEYAAVLITSPRFGCNQFQPTTVMDHGRLPR